MLDIPLRSAGVNSAGLRSRTTVLHVVSPDGRPAYSPSAGFLDYTASGAFNHRVISLARRAGMIWLHDLAGGDAGQPSAFEPASGRIGRHAGRRQIAEAMAGLLQREGIVPDLVQAEGLGVEASAANLIARRAGVPFVLALGDDRLPPVQTFAAALRSRRVLASTALVLLRPDWKARHSLAVDRHKTARLPYSVANATQTIRPVPASRGVLAVLPLDAWRRNGLKELLWGLAIAITKHRGLSLDVAGTGSPRAVNGIRALVAQLGIAEYINLLGPMAPRDVVDALPHYLALAIAGEGISSTLPIEALFAGIPLLQPEGCDVHGFFRGFFTGLPVDFTSLAATSEALSNLVENSADYRAAISRQGRELFEMFSLQGVSSTYEAAIMSVAAPRPFRMGADLKIVSA